MRNEIPEGRNVRRFAIVTLGCKVNQYESEALGCCLVAAGWQPAADRSADLCLINTCTVTGKAAMQSRQAVRRALRRHAAARIVVTGCAAQMEPARLAAIDGVALVVGHAGKEQIAALVESLPPPGTGPAPIVAASLDRTVPFAALSDTVVGGRTRPFLKIQDGCNAFCTYCIVPYARGRSRSMPASAVIARITDLARAGYHEVVLTGIHLGCYGRDLSPTESLDGLLARIEAARAIGRVRLSSIEPREFDRGLIATVAGSSRFCRHFHIPLQSGSDAVLRRMGRPYRAGEVRRLVADLLRAVPQAAVGMDLLVGFPGESDEAFAATWQLVVDLPVAYLHVFPFSPRAGTPAANMADPVPTSVAQRRCARLRRLGRAKRLDFFRRFVGHTVQAPVEARRDPASGRLKAVTDNYLPVFFDGPDRLMNTMASVRIDGLDAAGRLQGHRPD